MNGITDNDQNHPPAQVRTRAGQTGLLTHRDSILEQVRNGTRLKDIAKQYGVTKSAITHALSDDPEYIRAKQEFHDSRLDEAEQMILDSDDSTSQARARSYWQAVSWRASKEYRDMYGDKPDTSSSFGQGGITINIGTVRPGVTIEQDGGVGIKEIE